MLAIGSTNIILRRDKKWLRYFPLMWRKFSYFIILTGAVNALLTILVVYTAVFIDNIVTDLLWKESEKQLLKHKRYSQNEYT